MINKKTGVTFLMFLMLIGFNCTKPIDLNQVKDLVLEPVIESSLIFYKATAADFFIGGKEETTAEDFVEIDLFNNSFVKDNLVKVEFVFDIENSINRAYQLRLNFIDAQGQSLESFNVNTGASPNNQIITSTHTEVFEDFTLERLKQSRIIAFTLVMLPGEAIDENTPGEISVQSKGVFSLIIN